MKKTGRERSQAAERRCFGGHIRGGLGGSPFLAKPNLAELEGRGRSTSLELGFSVSLFARHNFIKPVCFLSDKVTAGPAMKRS